MCWQRLPRYYWTRRAQAILSTLDQEKYDPVPIQRLLDEGILVTFSGHGSPPAKFKGKGEIPYVRVADIVNWEMYKNPTSGLPRHVYLKKKGKGGVDLQAADILFVRRGSYRIGTVAMVSPFDREVLLTKEFVVMRVVNSDNKYNINPYYLIYLLSHRFTQSQLPQKILIETTLPNIGDRWKELVLPVHKNAIESEKITTRIKDAFDSKWRAQTAIQELRTEYGGITT